MPRKFSAPPRPIDDRPMRFAAIQRLIDAGMARREACRTMEMPEPTFITWQQAAREGRVQDGRRGRSGRKPCISLTPEEQTALQRIYLLKDRSFTTAVEFFLKDSACLPDTARFIRRYMDRARARGRKPDWPESFQRYAQLPPGVVDHLHGPDAARQAAPVGRYKATVSLEDGSIIPLVPGFAWTFDDYSANEPYQLEYAPGETRTCRQVLAGMDIGTRGWLGFYHVGKERDSYAGSDVLDVIRLCMEGQGHVPDAIILEQGRWKGNAVRGIEMEGKGSRRWGSIEGAGLRLKYVTKSSGKFEIEGGFDLLQTWCAGEGAGIGRFRGLFERESKNMLAINSGVKRDATACGFLTVPQSAALHEEMGAALNDRPKDFEALGRVVSANQLLEEQPFEKRPLKPEHRWLFFPYKGRAIIRQNGNVIVQVGGVKYYFRVNGVSPDVSLHNGHRVFIAFDPERTELGACIANAQKGTLNRDGYEMGQVLLLAAPLLQGGHRIDFYEGDEEDAEESAYWKNYKGAIKSCRSSFRTIIGPGGKRGLRADTIRNRRGDRLEMVSGAAESGPELAPVETVDHAPEKTGGRGGSRLRDTRPEGAAGVDTAHSRQTRLKTPANTMPDPADTMDLDAMEAAMLASL